VVVPWFLHLYLLWSSGGIYESWFPFATICRTEVVRVLTDQDTRAGAAAFER